MKRFTIRRAIVAIATAAAGTGTVYYATAPSPQTTTHAFTLEFPCGQFSLYEWHKILSAEPEAFGNPLIVWTALMMPQPEKGPTT